ncbi:acyl-CoA dehydrogenase family protein [SAR86 cluster bacterium]|jgi:alkylation response protein AidB-like acyl-CoA dehydrogenase|nr:acyl-CoA dehydrogenase family protein [SAR86 cluster bacterium]MEC7197242.1 acyl-CoA dehydrogenase family protein [Pseudomonadota bacterium]MEC9226584.1 acyl-CoA dehydrogenase family protein [Pseudomonadota bacterium]GIR51980.1 MAG: acyl-CoA dehydrogenase [Gammaproteobacteria bacterium]|tara:strand:+ start:104 stop:1306 length:1203 start_codon:yes stop_codon:yes gene_type:complete
MSKDWTKIRAKVKDFIENEIYPKETELAKGTPESREMLGSLMQLAKDEKIWALGHPTDIGGGGMPFMEYVYVNEVIGRSSFAMVALGTHSLQDSIMLREFASPHWRDQYLEPLVQGEIFPSFGMTEPEVASSDPTQLQTTAILEDGVWRINGRKWFTTGAARAAYTTVMCRTELEAPSHGAFSMIIVPTDNPGYKIVRETPVLGINGGHYEVEYDNVEVPEENLLGPRGQGFIIAQKRLGPGRIFHCMRWLGQAQRAFDLLCERMHERETFGTPLTKKQLLQKFVFDSACEIQASRHLTLDAAKRIDQGDDARIEIGLIKVVGAEMLHNVIDRAIQVHGAKGLTDDTPLSLMYRHAREARIYDGPDEVHIQSVARRILKNYEHNGPGWDFGERDASLVSS